jgi:hypothetical protein
LYERIQIVSFQKFDLFFGRGSWHQNRTFFFIFCAVELKKIVLVRVVVSIFIKLEFCLQFVLSDHETLVDDFLEVFAFIHSLCKVENETRS